MIRSFGWLGRDVLGVLACVAVAHSAIAGQRNVKSQLILGQSTLLKRVIPSEGGVPQTRNDGKRGTPRMQVVTVQQQGILSRPFPPCHPESV